MINTNYQLKTVNDCIEFKMKCIFGFNTNIEHLTNFGKNNSIIPPEGSIYIIIKDRKNLNVYYNILDYNKPSSKVLADTLKSYRMFVGYNYDRLGSRGFSLYEISRGSVKVKEDQYIINIIAEISKYVKQIEDNEINIEEVNMLNDICNIINDYEVLNLPKAKIWQMKTSLKKHHIYIEQAINDVKSEIENMFEGKVLDIRFGTKNYTFVSPMEEMQSRENILEIKEEMIRKKNENNWRTKLKKIWYMSLTQNKNIDSKLNLSVTVPMQKFILLNTNNTQFKIEPASIYVA